MDADRYVTDPETGARYPIIAGGYGTEVVAIAAIISAVTAVAAAGVGAYASYQQGQAQRTAARYNAALAEQQAEAQRTATAFAERQQREHDRRQIARARNLYGASGVDVGAGSPLLVELDSVRQAEYNAQAVRYGGEARAHFLEAQGGLDRFMGQQYGRAGTLGAGYSLLSGLGSAAGRLYSGFGASSRPTTAGGFDAYALGG